MIENIQQEGARSLRAIVTDFLAAAEYGSLVTYDELGAIVGMPYARSDEHARRVIQRLVNRSLSSLERDFNKTACSVPKEGYRIAEPNEMVTVGFERDRRATRGRKRALRVVQGADFNLLSEAERSENMEVQRRLKAKLRSDKENSLKDAREQAIKRALGIVEEVGA